eukprot:gb/GECH01000565.1/.p1 GENE.gb/GECH01000565.1/~~gb/GECH01000565.1/.p1  ORF type:complete len:742 (+),score=281.04 gb/GECH01000565.1/:1-2226(+)
MPPVTDVAQQPQQDNEQNIVSKSEIIIPPEEIKAFVDKTAKFVAKNGPQFEQKIAQSAAKTNVKLQFIYSENPYHKYYRHRVQEFSEMLQRGEELPEAKSEQKTEQKNEQEKQDKEQQETEGEIKEEAKVMSHGVDKGKLKSDPSPTIYGLKVPDTITALELDIIKLTAQYCARNGTQFLSAISGRESRNPQFDFLKIQHPHFKFFTKLTDVYKRIMDPKQETLDRLNKDRESRLNILDRCYAKAEWLNREEEQKREQEEDHQDRTAFGMIDWDNFVVAKKIDFDDEDVSGQSAAQSESHEEEGEEEPMDEGEDMDVDMDEGGDMDTEEEERQKEEEEEEDEDMAAKVRKDYRRQPKKQAQPEPQYFKHPETGELIPQEQAKEHLRVQLLNPAWRDQKEKEMKKFKDTALASDQEMVESIGRFAERRTDIFGNEELEVGKRASGDEQGSQERVIWDGHTASIARTASAAMQGMSVQDQIAAAHAQKGLTSDNSTIGPQQPSQSQPQQQQSQQPQPQQQQQPPPPPPPSTTNNAPVQQSQPPPQQQQPPPPPPPQQSTTAQQQPPPPQQQPPPPPPPAAASTVPASNQQPPPPPPPASSSSSPGTGVQQPPPPPVSSTDTDQSGEPATKKPRTESQSSLVPEDQWLEQHPDPVSLKVVFPNVSEKKDWKLDGRIADITLNPKDTISVLKDRVFEESNLPQKKQKLNVSSLGFLKDRFTAAYYNLESGTEVFLGVKERGGRKK